MKLRTFLGFIALALAIQNCLAQTASEPNEGSRLTRDSATGVYSFLWWGVNGRTYFVQQSENLADWTYLPVIESGSGQSIQWGLSSSADRSFMRLRYSDLATADPFAADFDGDKVSNYEELLQGTDPLSWQDGDATHPPNGLPDDWELHFFGTSGVDPSADRDGDGLTNLHEFQQGSDPNNFFNGHVPLLAKISGDNQNGYVVSGSTVTPAVLAPLKVQITDASSGAAFANMKVRFAPIGSASAQVAASSGSGALWKSEVYVSTDSLGNAMAWVAMPATVPPVDQEIEVSAVSTYPVRFTVHVPNGNGQRRRWLSRLLGNDAFRQS